MRRLSPFRRNNRSRGLAAIENSAHGLLREALNYGYDPAGNVVSIAEVDVASGSIGTLLAQYDPLDRLVRVDYPKKHWLSLLDHKRAWEEDGRDDDDNDSELVGSDSDRSDHGHERPRIPESVAYTYFDNASSGS